MKVVIFCGGLGLRMREQRESIPKPMVPIGSRPILWHLMKYYAYYGHRDFILCIGYKGDTIRDYFLNYNQSFPSDCVVSGAGEHLRLYSSDIEDCRITFADTGVTATIGQRLKAAQKYLDGQETFLANYADGLTDLYLPDLIQRSHSYDRVATFLSVRPNLTYDLVSAGDDGVVGAITPISQSNVRINGGFFVFKQDIFRYLNDGEELVREAFQRLIEEKQLVAYRHNGFWKCMDTFKDKQELEDLVAQGKAPWEVWNSRAGGPEGLAARPHGHGRTAAH